MDASNYRMVVTSGYDYVSTGSIADGQLRRWLRDVEKLDPDDLPPGVRLDTDSAADLHGAYTRWRLRESGPDGIRQLTLVVRARSGDTGPWVRLEVEHLPAVAGGQPARSGAPELAAALLTEVRATDGPVAVTARPVVLSEADLPRLLDELRDRRRRLPVVLLAVPPALAEPLAGELAGLAVGYLLNPEVAAAVNQVLVNHRVPPGGARCYLPGVEPEQAVDGFRHPAIPAFPRLGQGDELARAARLLARLPRRLAVRAPLPAELAALPALRTRPSTAADACRSELEHLRADNAVLNALLDEAAHEETARLREIGELRQELREKEEHAADLSTELAERADELRHAEARLREVQRYLIDLGEAGAGYRAAYRAQRAPHGGPVSFEELLDRFAELPELRFTGSRRVTVQLDAQALGADWAATAWDALLALRDYARAKRDGGHLRDFLHWCRETPPGGHRFPPGKVVRDESPQTSGRKAWRLQRTFPVPESVDPSGAVFMGAHLRIGAGNAKAPRLHFHDATGHGGLVYLGYLGPHLNNTLSSSI